MAGIAICQMRSSSPTGRLHVYHLKHNAFRTLDNVKIRLGMKHATVP